MFRVLSDSPVFSAFLLLIFLFYSCDLTYLIQHRILLQSLAGVIYQVVHCCGSTQCGFKVCETHLQLLTGMTRYQALAHHYSKGLCYKPTCISLGKHNSRINNRLISHKTQKEQKQEGTNSRDQVVVTVVEKPYYDQVAPAGQPGGRPLAPRFPRGFQPVSTPRFQKASPRMAFPVQSPA